MFLVEVARSCPQECRFCLASYLTRPFRPASLETIIEKVDLGLKYTSRIGLVGPSVTEHPDFSEIARALLARESIRISIASVRADTLNPTVLNMLSRLGQQSVTIALESGSERLRLIMKKNLTTEAVQNAVDLIDAAGLRKVKFYGMVGLPGENDADLDQTVNLMLALKASHRRLRFVLGLSSFVPKAQTPFQWSGRDRSSGAKIEYLRKRLAGAGVEVRAESHNWSDIQALISRGDRRLTRALVSLAGGAANLGAWRQAMRQGSSDSPPLDFFVFREIPRAETLPWSHLVDLPRAGSLEGHMRQASELMRSQPA